MVKTSDHITGPNCSDKEPINFGIKFVAATASLESRKFLGQFWRVHNCSANSDTPNRLRECGKDVAQPNSDGTNLVKVTCEKNRQDGKEGGSAIKMPRTPHNFPLCQMFAERGRVIIQAGHYGPGGSFLPSLSSWSVGWLSNFSRNWVSQGTRGVSLIRPQNLVARRQFCVHATFWECSNRRTAAVHSPKLSREFTAFEWRPQT